MVKPTFPIVPLNAGDYEEAILFLNRVFGYSRETGFEKLLPGLYKPTDEMMGCIYAMREEGKIIATIGIYPIEWQLLGRQLQAGGIGGVAVAPDLRGKGIMSQLLTFAIERMKQEGYSLSFLAGLRHRYRYYGWELCGCGMTARLRRSNYKHAGVTEEQINAITFEPLAGDAATLADLHQIHQQQVVRCERTANRFGDFLRHWNLTPYIASNAENQTLGYAVIDSNNQIVKELVLADDRQAIAALASLQRTLDCEALELEINPLDTDRLRSLGQHAECITQKPAGNWQIFDWTTTLNVLLYARCSTKFLPDGEVVIEITETNQRYVLSVTKGRPEVQPIQKEPAFTATREQWMRILFGPTRPSDVAELPRAASILEAWCPLPLSLARIDHV